MYPQKNRTSLQKSLYQIPEVLPRSVAHNQDCEIVAHNQEKERATQRQRQKWTPIFFHSQSCEQQSCEQQSYNQEAKRINQKKY